MLTFEDVKKKRGGGGDMSLLTSEFTKYRLFSVFRNVPKRSAQSHLKDIVCSINVLKYLRYLTLTAVLSKKNAVYLYH